MPPIVFYIKFDRSNIVERWSRETFEEFWQDLKEFMLRNGTRLEWIIRE